jgi:hypothetical protein
MHRKMSIPDSERRLCARTIWGMISGPMLKHITVENIRSVQTTGKYCFPASRNPFIAVHAIGGDSGNAATG